MKFVEPIEPPPDWANLHYHPMSQLTEFNSQIDFEGMVYDMEHEGYDESKPIVIFFVEERKRDEIIGGRHRHQGAIRAEVVPSFARFIGKSLEKYIQRELRRQHLDESQRAVLAAQMANAAKGGQPSNPPIDGFTIGKAAETMNVSPKSVERAKAVLEKGSEKLQEAVKSGKLKVSAAAAVVNESQEVQDEVADQSGPILCSRCKRVGAVRNCPVCAEAQAKADKPKLKKKKGTPTYQTPAAKPLDWKWFDKAIAEMNRFFLELKAKDKDLKEKTHRAFGIFTNAAKRFQYEENPQA